MILRLPCTNHKPSPTLHARGRASNFALFTDLSMYLPWLLLVLAAPLMASASQKPDPASPDYQQQVAASIQDLTSGRRPRDPRMSGASTGRLVIEGVIENLRIYRIHKQEKAREAKAREEEERKRRERKAQRHHGIDGSRERERRHRSHRHRSHERDGDRCCHRRRHRSIGDGEGHIRRHHCHRSREQHGDRSPGDRGDHEHQQNQRSRSTPGDEPASSDAQRLISGALHAAGALFCPDGTPFGSIPTRDKGVGLIPHTKTMYRHIKAEQDAGHRSKGFAEKHIDAFLQKRRDTKIAVKGVEEEPLIEKTRHDRDGRDTRDRSRKRHCRSRSQGGGGRSRRDVYPTYGTVENADQRHDAHGEPLEPSQSLRRGWQSTPFTQRSPPPVQPSRRSSRHDRDGGHGPTREAAGAETGESGKDAGRPPSVLAQSPAPPVSARSERTPTRSIRSAPSVRDSRMDNAANSPSVSRPPTIRVQSPTPPAPAKSGRPPTPFASEMPSRVQWPESELDGPASPVRSPAPSQSPIPPPMPTSSSVVATPYPATPSVVDIPVPVVPAAPMPLPPPPFPLPKVDRGRNAFLVSIQGGVKLKKVGEEEKKDKSAARKDEARIEIVSRGPPIYEGTPHSHDVEALEHAQAVEEMERRQEEECAARTKTPLTAPQPRIKTPTNFQDELAATLSGLKLNKRKDRGGAEAGPSEANVIRPRASNETWRTVFADQEEENRIPDRHFRQDLGDRLSAEGTPRPPTGMVKCLEVLCRSADNNSSNDGGPGCFEKRDPSAWCVCELGCEHGWIRLAIWTKLGFQ